MAKVVVPLAIVATTAMIGLSIARVSPSTEDAAYVLAMGGAAIGAIAVGVVFLLRSDHPIPPPLIESRKLKGLRVMVCGFLVALAGWLVAAFLSLTLGFVIAATGILVGAVGLVIHVVLLLGRR